MSQPLVKNNQGNLTNIRHIEGNLPGGHANAELLLGGLGDGRVLSLRGEVLGWRRGRSTAHIALLEYPDRAPGGAGPAGEASRDGRGGGGGPVGVGEQRRAAREGRRRLLLLPVERVKAVVRPGLGRVGGVALGVLCGGLEKDYLVWM